MPDLSTLTDDEVMVMDVPSPTLVLPTMTAEEVALHQIPYEERDYMQDFKDGYVSM